MAGLRRGIHTLDNRYLLKRKALAVGAEEWTDLDRAQVKHYVLTFVGYVYNIWVLCARLSEDSSAWDGCSITNICCSMCTTKVGVRKLESWINESTGGACRYMRMAARPM